MDNYSVSLLTYIALSIFVYWKIHQISYTCKCFEGMNKNFFSIINCIQQISVFLTLSEPSTQEIYIPYKTCKIC